jgi:hypothetical protein
MLGRQEHSALAQWSGKAISRCLLDFVAQTPFSFELTHSMNPSQG